MAGTTVDARKNPLGREAALALARGAETVVVARGKRILTFDMSEPHSDETLLEALLGPTGNLKAPTLRRGSTLLVGFTEEAYRQVLEGSTEPGA